MSWHKEDYIELKDDVVDRIIAGKDWVKANPKKAAFIAAFALAFALGVWARSVFAAIYTCTGSVPGSLACVEQAGGGAPDPVPVPPDVSACPAGTVFIRGQWGNSAIETANFGPFGNNVLVVEVKVPAGATGTRTSSWAEFMAGAVVRHAAFSTKPCDFTPQAALKTSMGAAIIVKDVTRFSFPYRIGAAGTSTAGLEAGKTYYINVQNRFGNGAPTCTIADCSMRGGLPG